MSSQQANQPPSSTTRKPFCKLPKVTARALESPIDPRRERLIRTTEKKWVNGTVLHYHFLQDRQGQTDAVRQAFAQWKDLGVGLEFQETHRASEAELRIAFDHRDGSWSYVGRDAIDFVGNPAQPTINFGWDLTTPYGRDTALHEIGHALGFNHEHQNPEAGIEWNEPAVYAYFSEPPNSWTQEMIEHNILRKLSAAETDGSPWDRNSIMHYEFDKGLIRRPEVFQNEPLIPEPGLSPMDIEMALRFYPAIEPQLPELKPWHLERIQIQPGQQLNWAIRPEETRVFTMQTLGPLDTVMVLFENIDGTPRYMAGDDDSGWSRNAQIQQRLVRGRDYVLRIRMFASNTSGGGALLLY